MAFDDRNAYRVLVDIPYGQLQHTLDLCEKICEAEYKFDQVTQYHNFTMSTSWEFFFESEKDYVAFLLWKK